MRILPLLVAIACYHCVGSVPAAILSRIRRVSGYEDPELDKDETTTDYMDYSYEEYEVYDESMFTCISGNEKIPLELMCDGFYDCTDRSDEVIANCQDNGISRTAVTTTAVPVSSETTATMLIEPDIMYVGDYEDYVDACTENEFQCLSDISICLPHSQVCDDVNDCPGKEDESRCPGKQNSTTANLIPKEDLSRPDVNMEGYDCDSTTSFQCRSRPGDCVPRELLCDGFLDCDDGSDEERCGCGAGLYMCVNGKCLNASLRCDGSDDCGDFSDEFLGCNVISRNEKVTDLQTLNETKPSNSSKLIQKIISNQTIGIIRENTTGYLKSSALAETSTRKTFPSTDDGICSLYPCANEGKCIETGDSFVCLCDPKFKGPTCIQRARSSDDSDDSSSLSMNLHFLLYITVLAISCLIR